MGKYPKLDCSARLLRIAVGVPWLTWVTGALLRFLPLLAIAWCWVAVLWLIAAVPIAYVSCALTDDMDSFVVFLNDSVKGWIARIFEVRDAIPAIYSNAFSWIVGRVGPPTAQ